MKHVKDNNTIDAIADENDLVNVDIYKGVSGGLVLCINVNGETILRIGRIKKEIEVVTSDNNVETRNIDEKILKKAPNSLAHK